MTARIASSLAFASAVCLLCLLSGCFGARGGGDGEWSLDQQMVRAAEKLPDDARALITMTNELLSAPPADDRLVRALAAAELAVARQPGYRTRWRAARAASYVGQWHSSHAAKLAAVHRGIDHARAAREAAPDRVGGFHFGAVNLGLLARLDPDGALSRLAEVVRFGERAREIDDGFQQGGPLRTLGAVYTQAPPWPTSVGDVEEAEEILTELVSRFPDYPLNHFFLGEALMKMSEYDRAAKAFEAVLRYPALRIWRLEGLYYRTVARQRLVDIQRMKSLGGR